MSEPKDPAESGARRAFLNAELARVVGRDKLKSMFFGPLAERAK
jgi:hypothetical protein